MKDFKLKTLAAVCLLTFSAYGMEESPENSRKSSETFLYCVDDEDIEEKITAAQTYDLYFSTRNKFVSNIEALINIKEHVGRKDVINLINDTNTKSYIALISEYMNPEYDSRQEKKYWKDEIEYAFKISLGVILDSIQK